MDKIVEEVRSVAWRYRNPAMSREGTVSWRCVAIVSGALLLFVESAVSMVYRWDDLGRRFLAIEDVNIWVCMLAGMYHFFFLPEENRNLLNILVEKTGNVDVIDRETAAILKQFKAKTDKELKSIKIVLLLILSNYALTPLALTFYKSVVLNEKEPIDLNLPFEFYNLNFLSAFKVNGFVAFALVNIFQIVFVKIVVDVSKFMFISFTGPINKIVLDIKLLCVAIRNIDDRIKSDLGTSNGDGKQNDLKFYMRNIIRQHIHLCRNITLVNKSIRVLAFCTLQCSCTQVCLLFYWILQVDETVLRQVIDASQVLAVCGYAYLYSAVGQDIINEDDVLRRTLFECSWATKPEWFKRSLLIMLIRANRKLEIRPFGLFVIDYKNFSSVMNAAYSYYNLLRTTRNINI